MALVAGLALTATCFAAPHGGRGDRGGACGPAPRQLQTPKAIEHRAQPAPRAVPRPAPAHPRVEHHAPPLIAAYRTWTWVNAAWERYIDGIFCCGDGYYYDGYNYYYNGACYTRPPTLVTVWP